MPIHAGTTYDALCNMIAQLAGLSAARKGRREGEDGDEEMGSGSAEGKRRNGSGGRGEEGEGEEYDEDGNRLIQVCGNTYPRQLFFFRVAALFGVCPLQKKKSEPLHQPRLR